MIAFGRETSCESGSPWKLKPWGVILKDKDHGWSPLLWVVYLGFFFVDPVMSHASPRIWLLDLTGVVVFLVLYLGLFAFECPESLGAHRRNGAARDALPTHQRRRMHVLYFCSVHAPVLR